MNPIVEFLFPGRLHRLSYFLRVILLNGISGFVYSCSTTMNPRTLWLSVIALLIYEMFFVVLPRIRDIRMSGWWLLMAFIPLLNIGLGFILLFRAPSYATETAG